MPNGQNQRRINYALAATLVMSGLTLEQTAPQVGAKNAETLRVGLAKRGVTCSKARALQSATAATTTPTPGMGVTITARIATQASSIIAEASGKLRSSLASVSQASAAVLDAKPAKNVKEVIQRASALKSLVDAGDKLHGWSAQASAPAWNVTILDRSAPSAPSVVEAPALDVIDVTTCVSDTPSGGVLPQPIQNSTPQAEQVIDVDSVASHTV